MRSGVFWGESKSGRSQLLAIGPNDGNDFGCADGAEAMVRGNNSDGGGGIISPVTQEEEYSGARLDLAGYGGLKPEVGDSLTVDGILLIVKGDENLCGIAEMLYLTRNVYDALLYRWLIF